MATTVQGIAHIWQIGDSPIGSGDAGEVYTVTRLDQPEVLGVLKKPAKIATGGTIQRQAGQIAQEAQALALLDGIPDGKAHPPRLLDQAPEFTRGTANYFIISETARGKALNEILAETLKTSQPFPQRVIMTVLDALFDMFSHAHKTGVMWNDVKLEHIYWDASTETIDVIDWGNAIFIESQGQPTHTRWQDYQQIIDALSSFLQNAAPDLYADLGWDTFKGKTLNASDVSALARQVSYQQQVVDLQLMENKSLMRVVLDQQPSLSGLKEIKVYRNNLMAIGALWAYDEALLYCQKLVEGALADNDIQTAVSATAHTFELFGEVLDCRWQLLREYCRHTDVLTHKAFADLAQNTLNKKWEAVYQIIELVACQAQNLNAMKIGELIKRAEMELTNKTSQNSSTKKRIEKRQSG
ncbi:MAG: hypothetical protein GX142_03975 [Chloroflexi bacterium]|nr:hypothetical protein [Chloroflexota bacterium]